MFLLIMISGNVLSGTWHFSVTGKENTNAILAFCITASIYIIIGVPGFGHRFHRVETFFLVVKQAERVVSMAGILYFGHPYNIQHYIYFQDH